MWVRGLDTLSTSWVRQTAPDLRPPPSLRRTHRASSPAAHLIRDRVTNSVSSEGDSISATAVPPSRPPPYGPCLGRTNGRRPGRRLPCRPARQTRPRLSSTRKPSRSFAHGGVAPGTVGKRRERCCSILACTSSKGRRRRSRGTRSSPRSEYRSRSLCRTARGYGYAVLLSMTFSDFSMGMSRTIAKRASAADRGRRGISQGSPASYFVRAPDEPVVDLPPSSTLH